MVKRDKNISRKKIDLEVERSSLVRNFDRISSFENEERFSENSREILLFRYPAKKIARL